jgi:hypothetical protein
MKTKVYIDTHTQLGNKYPNDEVRARVVWFLHLILKYICILAYLFRNNTYLVSLAWLNLFSIGVLFLTYRVFMT